MNSTKAQSSSNHSHKDVDNHDEVVKGVGIRNDEAAGVEQVHRTGTSTYTNIRACTDRTLGAVGAAMTTKQTSSSNMKSNNINITNSSSSMHVAETTNIQRREHDDIRDEANYIRFSRQKTSTNESSSECTSPCNTSIINVDSIDMEGSESRCHTVREQNSASPSTVSESSGAAFLSITNASSSSLSPSSSPKRMPVKSSRTQQGQAQAKLTFSNSIMQLASSMRIDQDNESNLSIGSNVCDDDNDDDLSYSCGASTSTYSSRNTGSVGSKNKSNTNTNNSSDDDSSSISTTYSKSTSSHLLLKGIGNEVDDNSLALANNNAQSKTQPPSREPQQPHKIIITNIQKSILHHNKRCSSGNKDKASDKDHGLTQKDNDNASFKSSKSFVTNGSKSTAFTSFTYGEQSTMNRSFKILFSGNFSLKDMNMEDQSTLLKQQQRLGENENDASSYLSSHFGDLDGDEYSYILDTNGLDNDDSNGGGDEISGERGNQEEDQHSDDQQEKQIDTSIETEYISIEEHYDDHLNIDGEDSKIHKDQQSAARPNLNECNKSPIVTPPPQKQLQQDECRGNLNEIHNIILNTAEKEKDDRHRKKLLDIVTHNVIVAETNAQRMEETIESLHYQQLNRSNSSSYSFDRQCYNYLINSLRDSSLYEESLDEYEHGDVYKEKRQQVGEMTHEEAKDKKNGYHNSRFGSINLKSFISLPKANFFSSTPRPKQQESTHVYPTQHQSTEQKGTEKNCNDCHDYKKGLSFDDVVADVNDADLAHTNYIASRQAKIISDIIEPDCQNMKHKVWKNRSECDGGNRILSDDEWRQRDSTSSLITPKKKNNSRRHRKINDNCDDRWFVQTSPNIQGVYYYQPSTGAISREKPPTYHHMGYTNREDENSTYMKINNCLNYDFLRLVSPIHPKKKYPRRKVAMSTHENSTITAISEKTGNRSIFQQFVNSSVVFAVFILMVSVSLSFGNKQYVSSLIGPQCSNLFYQFLSWSHNLKTLMTFEE